MSTDAFTHLRTIRFAEDRLRLLRAARAAYRGAMESYLARLDREIAREESPLADAHTARTDDSPPCLPFTNPRARSR